MRLFTPLDGFRRQGRMSGWNGVTGRAGMFHARCFLFTFLATLMFGAGPAAAASVQISINKPSQRMTVSVNGVPKYVWLVSTGGRGYATPSGSYTPFRMEPDHYSKEWDD